MNNLQNLPIFRLHQVKANTFFILMSLFSFYVIKHISFVTTLVDDLVCRPLLEFIAEPIVVAKLRKNPQSGYYFVKKATVKSHFSFPFVISCTFLPKHLKVWMKTCISALNRSRHRFSSARNAAYQGGPFFP